MFTPSRPDLHLRPVRPADHSFLEQLYGSTRAAELAQLPWPREQEAAFVAMQFRAQDSEWRRRYDPDGFFVILEGGDPVGRLYLCRLEDELRVVDLAILPAHRGKGIGTSLLHDVIVLGDAEGRPVTLHVELGNPARRLYDRLGFREVTAGEVYVLLARPAQLNTAS